MRKSLHLKNFLGVLAVADLAALAAVVVGGNSCKRGDGCLFYSALFFAAVGAALLVLISATAVWIKTRRHGSSPIFFIASTLALLAAVVVMLGALIVEVNA